MASRDPMELTLYIYIYIYIYVCVCVCVFLKQISGGVDKDNSSEGLYGYRHHERYLNLNNPYHSIFLCIQGVALKSLGQLFSIGGLSKYLGII